MKKSLVATLLVALLASSMVFAGFSGNATVGAFYNFDKNPKGSNDFGFANGTSVNFDLALGTEDVDKKAEGDIYASIKATLSFSFIDTDADGVKANDPINNWTIKPIAKITEAKVGGENWYVSILGTVNRLDLAKSAIDTWEVKNEIDDYGRLKADYDKNASYAIPNTKAPGVEVNYAGYSLAVGGKKVYQKAIIDAKPDPILEGVQTAITVHAKTPEISLMEGLTLQAGAAFNKGAKVTAKSDEGMYAGGSVKVAYAKDPLTLSLASDMGYSLADKKLNADVAAQAKYDFIAVDAYYATNVVFGVKEDNIANLLSARLITDLNSFNVPVKLTVAGKDLVNAQNLSAEVEVAFSGLTLKPNFGYGIKSKDLSFGLKAEYKMDILTAKAGVAVKFPALNTNSTVLGV
ncbi:MAG: hypothetical protein GX903_11020, partial [Spirochaetales bacterium]|nr:hypothetical protein [Spirochaetales bacterium]